MKRSILVTAFVAATFSIASTPAFAQQHGRPASPGAGAPSAHGSNASTEGGHSSSGATSSPSSPSTVLSRNPNVEPALTRALGKSGITLPPNMTLSQVCSQNGFTTKGFRTLGQCIAALHINHKFSTCTLADLSNAKNLGAGIQACRPDADAKAEARSATKQAEQEIKDSNS